MRDNKKSIQHTYAINLVFFYYLKWYLKCFKKKIKKRHLVRIKRKKIAKKKMKKTLNYRKIYIFKPIK